MANPYAKYVTPAQPANPYAKYAQQPVPPEAPMPQASAVLSPPAPAESREDELRRKAQEDIVAGMTVGEKALTTTFMGIQDIAQGAKQMALHAPADNFLVRASKAILPDSGDANVDWALDKLGLSPVIAEQKRYDKQLQDEEKEYNLALGKDPVAIAGRLAGNVVGSLPLGGPMAKGGGILANMGKNAITSGIGAAVTTPVRDGGENFATSKAAQTAIGAGGGAAVSGLLQGAGKLIEEIPGGNLLRRGYNAIAGRANAKPAAAEGEALAKQFGIELTPGQVSGGKGQLAVENMARQSIFTRDKVFETDMKIADQYADAINKTLDKISTKGGDAASAGKSIRESVDKSVEQLSKRRARLANEDFKLVDELAKGAPIIKPDSYKAKLAELLDDYSAAQDGDEFALASSLKKMIDNAGMMESAAGSIAQRRHLSRVAGGQTSLTGTAGQPIQKRAAAQLLTAIDKDIDEASSRLANKSAPEREWTVDKLIDGNINPLNRVDDKAKLEAIKQSMRESGWVGRPVLAYDNGDGVMALTGSHRIAATNALKKEGEYVSVPVRLIDDAALEFEDSAGRTFYDLIDRPNDDGLDRFLREAGDIESAELIEREVKDEVANGPSIGELLKKANDRYRAYSQKIDGIKKGPVGKILGKDLVDVDGQGFGSVSAEQIFAKFSKLPPDHIHVALKSLSPEATAQVKRAYVQKALEAAQQPTATGGATQASIRPTTFVASLQRNPEDKRRIAALFTPDERKELDALMSVGRRIGDRTGANTSETAVMSQTMGILEKLRSGTLRGLAEVGGAALGTREIARIMADSGGRKALMELRRLPPGSAKARDLAAYIGGLAAAKETDE